jgi:HopA1 effector protein family
MKDLRLISEIEEIIHSFFIISSNEFSFLDHRYIIENNNFSTAENQQEILDKSIATPLQQLLYFTIHCRQKNIGNYLQRNQFENSFSIVQQFMTELSKANCGSGTLEPGWVIKGIHTNGRLLVHRDGLTISALREEFFPKSGQIKPGRVGFLKVAKESKRLSPGFYVALGNASKKFKIDKLVRIYWNISSSGSIFLMKYITHELNRIDMPFQFKILNDPRHFSRADAAVLYIEKKYLKKSLTSLQRIYESIKLFLKNPTPIFAKRIASGIAIAEDPSTGESFGQHRCRILAEALLNHQKVQHLSRQNFLGIQNYCRNYGFDLDQPHINPGSIDDYDLLFDGVFK